MHRYPLAAVLLLAASTCIAQEGPIDIPYRELQPEQENPRYRIIGELKKPLGSIVVAKGVFDNPITWGYVSGPNLRVQSIYGRATQELIRIELVADENAPNGFALSKLKEGRTYEFEGYETGGFRGRPVGAGGFESQGPSMGFYTHYCVYKGKEVDPVRWAPADFLDREALLMGRALSGGGKAFIAADGWRLMVDVHEPWPERYRGKEVEGFGVVRRTDVPGVYRMEGATTRLVWLEDQIGCRVTLRGYRGMGPVAACCPPPWLSCAFPRAITTRG